VLGRRYNAASKFWR